MSEIEFKNECEILLRNGLKLLSSGQDSKYVMACISDDLIELLLEVHYGYSIQE